MSKLLFKLRNVPEDEVLEVRALLDQHGIEFFETSSGNWGISMPGLWLVDASDYDNARALLDEYQVQRTRSERLKFEELKRQGKAPSLWSLLREKPLIAIIQLAALALIVYLSLHLFPGM